jgi:DNA-binding beta-propeller fold protein YncE
MKNFLAVCAMVVSLPALAQMVGVTGGSGNPGAFLQINQSNGAVTNIGTPYGGDGLPGLAVQPATGRVFAVTSVENADNTSHLIEIDPATGSMVTDLGAMYDSGGNGCGIGDLAFRPSDGMLFGLTANQSDVGTRCGVGQGAGGYLVTIDLDTAEYTLVGRDASLGNANGGIAFAPNGTLYFTPCWDNPGNLHTLNPATGGILTTQPLESGGCFMGLGVRDDGVIFASYNDEASDRRIFTINPVNGDETLVGDPGDMVVQDLAFLGPAAAAAAPVPSVTPAGLAAIALALALAGILVIRRH